MNFAKFIAAQLRQPSGFFGRYVMVHLLNIEEVMNHAPIYELYIF